MNERLTKTERKNIIEKKNHYSVLKETRSAMDHEISERVFSQTWGSTLTLSAWRQTDEKFFNHRFDHYHSRSEQSYRTDY